jgi:hypothetical protein
MYYFYYYFIKPLGFEVWGVKAGHTYEMLETAAMSLKLYDTSGKVHEFKVPGTTTLGDFQEQGTGVGTSNHKKSRRQTVLGRG